MNIKRIISTLFILVTITLFSGCAAIGTAVSHRNLETQTLMSNSVFLSPESVDLKPTIFIMLTNTTDHPDFSIKSALLKRLESKGYTIVNHPQQASFILQVNILQVGQKSKTAAQEMMSEGYGGALEGVVSGVAIAATGGANVVVGGVAGGVATSVTDNFVKDVTYTVISDIKLSQKFKDNTITDKTRILSMANRVNLAFDSAKPLLVTGLSDAISGLFIQQTTA